MTMRHLSPLFTWRGVVASDEGPADPSTRLVLLVLSLHMNEKGGSCFPSLSSLSVETGLDRRTVQRHIKKAVTYGWISIKKVRTGGQKWQRNDYTATVPDCLQGGGTVPLAEKEDSGTGSRGGGSVPPVVGAQDPNVGAQDPTRASRGRSERTPTTTAGACDLVLQAQEVIEFLNTRTGQRFPLQDGAGNPSNSVQHAHGLLATGYDPARLRQVIVRKWRLWGEDDTRRAWLKPSTLFNPVKFEEYAAECVPDA